MRLLIVYGTTEGQTRKICTFIRDRATAAGHDVTLAEAIDESAPIDPKDFDATIVAASLHTGRYQAAIEHFAHAHGAALDAGRSAFISVSLSAAGHDEDDQLRLQRCVAEFAHRTGWMPAVLHHAAVAFRYTQYDFFKKWALKYIAWKKGAPTDTSHDYELTAWDDLARFVDGFVTPVAHTASAGAA